MTIRELRAALSAFHPDARVVVRGYEAGYEDPIVRPARAWLDWPSGGGVYGVHAAEGDDTHPAAVWTDVVAIDADKGWMGMRKEHVDAVDTQED